MGELTQAFEREFAAYLGAPHALAVSSCTAALHMACLVAGLGPGDEAILPSLTFLATANTVRYTGATPVFADNVSETDLNISPQTIGAWVMVRAAFGILRIWPGIGKSPFWGSSSKGGSLKVCRKL